MPEPVLVSIAAALAGKAVTSLYDLVKKKFQGRRAALEALEAATRQPDDQGTIGVLADRLAEAEATDPEFATALRAEWDRVRIDQQADRGAVINQITGPVSGKALQARDIHGDVSF